MGPPPTQLWVSFKNFLLSSTFLRPWHQRRSFPAMIEESPATVPGFYKFKLVLSDIGPPPCPNLCIELLEIPLDFFVLSSPVESSPISFDLGCVQS